MLLIYSLTNYFQIRFRLKCIERFITAQRALRIIRQIRTTNNTLVFACTLSNLLAIHVVTCFYFKRGLLLRCKRIGDNVTINIVNESIR